jgi:hypothetical protein
MVSAVVMLVLSDQIFSQENVTVHKSYAVPDSARMDLAAKVDTSRIKANWDKLKKGMTVEQVRFLLGKPTRVSSDDHDDSTTWQYGKYTVVFDNVKKSVRFWDVLK